MNDDTAVVPQSIHMCRSHFYLGSSNFLTKGGGGGGHLTPFELKSQHVTIDERGVGGFGHLLRMGAEK